ncbi:MAG: hypothetical protein RTU30_06010 [Candidatus Thorarchaeota archaeon]
MKSRLYSLILMSKPSNGIGTLQERSLHASLKQHYSELGDKIEQRVQGYIIDIVRDKQLIEIQTGSFGPLRSKLQRLLMEYKIHIVHPIAAEKWIVRESRDGSSIIGRRRSPTRKSFANIFDALVGIPELLRFQNLSVEAVLIHEEEIRRLDGKGSWRRRGWSIIDKVLIDIIDTKQFFKPLDYLSLIPRSLEQPFTNRDLADSLNEPIRLAQRITYSLRKMGVIDMVGKRGRTRLHKICKIYI